MRALIRRKHLLFLYSIVVSILLTGCCSSLYKQNRASQQDDAASVHMAVLSVAPWEEYRDALQPTFKLTSEDALGQSIPSTLALEEKFLDAFSTNLKVAAPGSSSTDTSAIHMENGKVMTDTKDITKTASSGDTSKITFADNLTGNRTAAGLPPATSVLGTSLSINPMIKYLAATALYQEVQLLNRYVKNASIDERYSSYVVRLQVSLMPKMRDEPYDAYSTISFFTGPFDPNTGGGSPLKISTQVPDAAPPQVPTGTTINNQSTKSNDVKGVKIIPLLVTDDIEAAMHSRSKDDLRQIALALSAVIQGVGLGLDMQSIDEKLRTVLGRDFNSTFTVARVSDNTLRCRFGALNQAQARYAMIPQTHNVTLLVLVPRGDSESDKIENRTVRLTARTTLTDVESGKDLPGRTGKETHKAVEDILENHGITQLQSGDSRRILYSVAANDYETFNTVLTEMINRNPEGKPQACNFQEKQVQLQKPSYPESIWVDLVSVRNGSQYTSASFSVPQKIKPKFVDSPSRPQTPALIDDGKNASTVKLRGGTGLDSNKLAATITTGEISLAHTEIKVSSGGKEIEITFPSLAAYKLDTKKVVLKLYELEAGTLLKEAECFYLTGFTPTKPQFTMAARANIIEADKDSKGKVSVVFSGKIEKPGIFFTVKGADVVIEKVAASPTAEQKDDGWNVSGFGVVTLNLSNLDPISPITISAKDTSNEAQLPTIVLPVVTHAGTK